jgi:hypothetical protein
VCRYGAALDGAEKERYNEIATELSALSTEFSNNVLDATKAGLYKADEFSVEPGALEVACFGDSTTLEPAIACKSLALVTQPLNLP